MKKCMLLACCMFFAFLSTSFAADTLKVGVDDDSLTEMFSNKQTSTFNYDFLAVESVEESVSALNDSKLDVIFSAISYDELKKAGLNANSENSDIKYVAFKNNTGMYWKTSSAQNANIRLLYEALCSVPTVQCDVEE